MEEKRELEDLLEKIRAQFKSNPPQESGGEDEE